MTNNCKEKIIEIFEKNNIYIPDVIAKELNYSKGYSLYNVLRYVSKLMYLNIDAIMSKCRKTELVKARFFYYKIALGDKDKLHNLRKSEISDVLDQSRYMVDYGARIVDDCYTQEFNDFYKRYLKLTENE